MIVLSQQELIDLTQKTRPSAQARVLDFMGIPYRPRPGPGGHIASLAVLRIHVEAVRDGGKAPKKPEPQVLP